MWKGAHRALSKGDGSLVKERAVKAGLVREWALGCWGRRGHTFGAGQRLPAQGAEAEVLVEAAGLGLFQHCWAPIYPMQLEEAPSLQLGWEDSVPVHICHLPAGSLHLKEGSGPCSGCCSGVWETVSLRLGVARNLSKWGA